MCNQELEAIVILYQTTDDEKYFAELAEIYRSRIQGRAYKASVSFGLDDSDCESVLMHGLWKAAKGWDKEKGITFEKYVSVTFNQELNHLFQSRNFKDGHLELVYNLSVDNSVELVDMKQDIENLLAEQDQAKKLIEYIATKNSVAATVSVLKANEYSLKEIANALKYVPTSIRNVGNAQEAWTKRRLKDARKPAMDYYFKVLKVRKLPINITF
jgi:hypothetical protein